MGPGPFAHHGSVTKVFGTCNRDIACVVVWRAIRVHVSLDRKRSCGTVTEVSRTQAASSRFTEADSSNSTIELKQPSVSPERIWEIEPEFLDRFRSGLVDEPEETVEHSHTPRDMEDDDEPRDERSERSERPRDEEESRDERSGGSRDEAEASFRSALETKMLDIERTMETNMKSNEEFKQTIGRAIRELAGDLQRAYRGEPLEFTKQYVDRYDEAMSEVEAETETLKDEYRAATDKHSKVAPEEKLDFDVESIEYNDLIKESGHLTDDE